MGFNDKQYTLHIHTCRGHDIDLIPYISNCGRYGTQSPYRGVIRYKHYRPSAPIKPVNARCMVLRHTEQGDITENIGCTNPRTNFTQTLQYLNSSRPLRLPYNGWIELMFESVAKVLPISYIDLCIATEICDKPDIPPDLVYIIIQLNHDELKWSDELVKSHFYDLLKQTEKQQETIDYINSTLNYIYIEKISNVSKKQRNADNIWNMLSNLKDECAVLS